MFRTPPEPGIALAPAELPPQLRALRRLFGGLVCAGALVAALEVNVALHAARPAGASAATAALPVGGPARR